MANQLSGRLSGSLFTRFSYFLKAAYIFFPGIIFLVAGLFIFINLSQGEDVIYQSTDGKNSWSWAIAAFDFITYIFFYSYIERSFTLIPINKARWKRLSLIRNMVSILIILSCVAVVIGWQFKKVEILLYTLPIFQLGFLFLV